MTKPLPTESQEQQALFEWAAYAQGKYPELALMLAIPNGGHRHKATAGRLKAEGVKAGVPDIMLPVARCGYHGLFIEMKRASGGKLSQDQKRWLDELYAQGYACVVCTSWETAKKHIEQYLDEHMLAREV